MCYHKVDAVAEKTVGDLTVRVVYDDCGSGADNWDELRKDSRGHNLKFFADPNYRQGNSYAPAPAPSFRADLSAEDIDRGVAMWWRGCNYMCGDGRDCEDCQDRAEQNAVLEDWYFEETGWIGESRGWFCGEKTNFASREEFDRMCAGVSAEYGHLERGEVYGYEVVNADGDVLESCWGFVGEDDYCMAQGVEVAEALLADMAETEHICEPYESAGNGD